MAQSIVDVGIQPHGIIHVCRDVWIDASGPIRTKGPQMMLEDGEAPVDRVARNPNGRGRVKDRQQKHVVESPVVSLLTSRRDSISLVMISWRLFLLKFQIEKLR